MSLEALIPRTTHETPSPPMRETFIAPTLLPVCCLCGLVRDETGSHPGLLRWVTQRAYRETYGVKPTDLALTHTYCPECFTQAQQALRQYFRKT